MGKEDKRGKSETLKNGEDRQVTEFGRAEKGHRAKDGGGEKGQRERGRQIDRKEKDREREEGGEVLKVGETLAQGSAPKQLTSGWAPGRPSWQGDVDRDVPEDVPAGVQAQMASPASAPVSGLVTFLILGNSSFVWQINHSSQCHC